MAKTAEQMFNSLREKIETPSNIKKISQPLLGYFFIYTYEGSDHQVKTTSNQKANKIVELLNGWINGN